MQLVKTIIIINDFDYINGGGSQMAIGSANAFAELGFHVIFFSAVSDPEKKDLSVKIERYSTNQPDILTNPSRIGAFREGLWNRKAAGLLRSILEKADPRESIIHMHSWIKALSPSIGNVITGSGFHVVCTLHDYFVACPNGGFYNYQENKICHLKPMSLSCICTHCDARNYGHKLWRVSRQMVQARFGKIPGKIKHFIIPTRFSEAILRPYLPASAEVYILSNPVTNPLAGRPRADISSGRFLFVGRLSKEKGTELACEASRRAGARLRIIGSGPLENSLREKYPEVEFKGWLSPAEVFREMLQARALIFPSVCYETQGLAVPEALSAGLPVIVSDECAASEYVDTKNGFTFTSGDTGKLAEKIRVLMDDAGKAEEMSKYAYDKYWKQPFLPEAYINETLAIYDLIMKKDKTAAIQH